MAKNNPNVLHDAVENYYHYNPDTLMPLMMVALAAKSNLPALRFCPAACPSEPIADFTAPTFSTIPFTEG